VIEPIKPSAVTKTLPDEVIQIFNDMIQENWKGASATLLQNDLVAKIASVLDVPRQEVFDRGWLDVEGTFRKVGWKVSYDKPAYCETYKAYFMFEKASKRG